MAIFNENYMDSLYENESINESKKNDLLLDELLEACSNMLDILDESKTGYQRALAKAGEDVKKSKDDLYDAFDRRDKAPDKVTQTKEKKDLFGRKHTVSKEVPNKAKRELEKDVSDKFDKHLENLKNFDKLTGTTKSIEYDNKGRERTLHTPSQYDIDSINSGKESKIDKYDSRDTEYEKMAIRKARRDAKKEWNKEHGDVGEDKLAKKEPYVYRSGYSNFAHGMNYAIDHNKEIMKKNQEAKKKVVEETCLYILSILDNIE